MSKPYYDLISALYMAKEHGMRFDDLDLEVGGMYADSFRDLFELVNDEIDEKFYPSSPSVLEPQDGDESKEGFIFDDGGWVDGEHFFDQLEDPKLTAFRNGKPFLQPKYEVEND